MNYLDLKVVPPKDTNIVDIEASIEDIFMAALRAQFIHDPNFTYSKDVRNGKLEITLEYPERFDAPLSKPHILISNISYSMNLDLSMFRNFFQDKFDKDNFNDKSMKANIIPYSLSITAIGGKSTSKNLANRIVNYIGITYQKMYDDLGLNIMSVNKSPTTSATRYPEKVFETSIQIQGRLAWTGIISCINKAEEYVLSAVNVDVFQNNDTLPLD